MIRGATRAPKAAYGNENGGVLAGKPLQTERKKGLGLSSRSNENAPVPQKGAVKGVVESRAQPPRRALQNITNRNAAPPTPASSAPVKPVFVVREAAPAPAPAPARTPRTVLPSPSLVLAPPAPALSPAADALTLPWEPESPSPRRPDDDDREEQSLCGGPDCGCEDYGTKRYCWEAESEAAVLAALQEGTLEWSTKEEEEATQRRIRKLYGKGRKKLVQVESDE